MRRLCFLICLALASACGAVGQAQASPLMLSIWGYADNVPVDYVTDVSNGFSGATIPLSSVPLWAGTGPGPHGGETSMNSSISLGATLFNSTQNLASLGLNGQISGVVTYPNVYSLDPSRVRSGARRCLVPSRLNLASIRARYRPGSRAWAHGSRAT